MTAPIMTCGAFDEVAAELALDVLAGEERGRAIAHVEECDRCRRYLVDVTAAADRVVALAPPAEPPAGFEERVLAALTPAPLPIAPRQWWRSAGVAAAAAAVAFLVAVGALIAVGRSGGGQRETAMVSPSGLEVGDVYLHDGHPSWILVAVPAWSDRWGGRAYTVRVVGRDGTVTDIAGGDLAAGAGAWGTSVPMAADEVQSVELVGADGHVWCTGSFV